MQMTRRTRGAQLSSSGHRCQLPTKGLVGNITGWDQGFGKASMVGGRLSRSSRYLIKPGWKRQRRWVNSLQVRFARKQNFQILERVGPLWELSHANILGFQRNVNVGTMNPLRVPFAYDWGGEKNITEHIASNPDVSRPSLVCKFLLWRQLEMFNNSIYPARDG